ncbi:MAG TPA: hypothetical protein VN361_10340 [Oxalicibacterium sp.]|nr:hypothetical protein [Oxalicibacterium sp.]
MAMAVLFIGGAMWALMAAPDADQAERAQGASHAGHMLIPSGVPDQADRRIDRAIVREKNAAAPGERDAPGTAVDAIYRITPAAARKADRIMT